MDIGAWHIELAGLPQKLEQEKFVNSGFVLGGPDLGPSEMRGQTDSNYGIQAWFKRLVAPEDGNANAPHR